MPQRNVPRRPPGKGTSFGAALIMLLGVLAGCGGRASFVMVPRPDSDGPYEVRPAAVGAYTQGICAQLRGDWPRARERFAAAHELDPDSLRVLVRLAVSAHEAGMVEEARPLLRRAGEAAEQNPELALIVARFYARRADVENASRYYRIAASRQDILFTAVREEARVFERVGDFRRAEQNYASLLKTARRHVARAVLGEFYLRRGRHAEALEQLTKVTGALPYVYGEIAVCRAELGDMEDAVNSLAKYAECGCPARPFDIAPEGTFGRGRTGSLCGGVPWEPFLRVADTAMSRGRPAKALEVLRAALEIELDESGKRRIRDKINSISD